MSLKFFLPLILEMFKKGPNLVGAVTDSTDLLKKALREEVLSLSARILGGVIVSSVIIFALVTVLSQVNQMLLTQVRGEVLSIIAFSLIAAIGGVLLVPLLRNRKVTKLATMDASHASMPSFDLPHGLDTHSILNKFYEGLLDGIEKSSERAETRATVKAQATAADDEFVPPRESLATEKNENVVNLSQGEKYTGTI